MQTGMAGVYLISAFVLGGLFIYAIGLIQGSNRQRRFDDAE